MTCVAGLGMVAGIVFITNAEKIKDEYNTVKDELNINMHYIFQYGWAFSLNWAGVAAAILKSHTPLER